MRRKFLWKILKNGDLSCTVVQSLPAAGCADWFMVGDKKQDNLAKLEASLAPAEAEFGAVAKADQHF